MRKLRWQLIIIFLTGIVVGILLLGEQPDTQQQLKLQPVQGGIYSEALIGSIQRLNPVLDHYNSVDRDIDRLIYSGLIKFDQRGLPQPDIAESWGVSKDGTIYNFTLRSGVQWHDGQPLTSRDVVFTIDLLRQGGETIPQDIQNFWKEVEVRSLSDTSLQFQLPGSFAPFLDYLTFGILPQHMVGDLSFDQLIDSSFNLQPIGSGPFRFDKLIIENGQVKGVVLRSFDSYYGKKPYLEQVIFRYYPDGQSAIKAYQDGIVQGIGQVNVDMLPIALAERNLSIYSSRRPEIALIFLNLDNPEVAFFQDKEVRQALLMGINRQWIIDRLLKGQAVVTDSVILQGTWAYYDGLEKTKFDLDAAKEKLKQAGYILTSDGEGVRSKEAVVLKLTLLYPDDDTHRVVAEQIQKGWMALGVQVNLEAVSYDQLVNQRLDQRDYQAALVDLNLTRSPDPDPYPFWNQSQATGGQNYSQWDNRMASEYLEQARVENVLDERQRLYHNFQVIFSQELPALPLYNPIYNYAIDRQVRGVRVGPLFDSADRFSTITEWYLEAGMPSNNKDQPTPVPTDSQ